VKQKSTVSLCLTKIVPKHKKKFVFVFFISEFLQLILQTTCRIVGPLFSCKVHCWGKLASDVFSQRSKWKIDFCFSITGSCSPRKMNHHPNEAGKGELAIGDQNMFCFPSLPGSHEWTFKNG
jgi:hypothetical protein